VRRLLALLTAAALLGPGAAAAQPSLEKSLVGHWEGEQEALVEKNVDLKRFLDIHSVRQVDGKWIAEGRYGIPGKGSGPVRIEVDADAKPVSLRWTTSVRTQYEVFLMQDTHLVGKAILTLEQAKGARGGSENRERRLKLEKTN
jgi:hypothetical protein